MCFLEIDAFARPISRPLHVFILSSSPTSRCSLGPRDTVCCSGLSNKDRNSNGEPATEKGSLERKSRIRNNEGAASRSGERKRARFDASFRKGFMALFYVTLSLPLFASLFFPLAFFFPSFSLASFPLRLRRFGLPTRASVRRVLLLFSFDSSRSLALRCSPQQPDRLFRAYTLLGY